MAMMIQPKNLNHPQINQIISLKLHLLPSLPSLPSARMASVARMALRPHGKKAVIHRAE